MPLYAEGGSLVIYRTDYAEFDFQSAYLTGTTGSNGPVTINSYNNNVLVHQQTANVSNTPTLVNDEYTGPTDLVVIEHTFTGLAIDNGTFLV